MIYIYIFKWVICYWWINKRNYLRESVIIIQKNKPDKIKDLILNFKSIYSLLQDKNDGKYNQKYYDTLKYIFKQEIIKIKDITCHTTILDELIKQKEIIQKSINIFQILLKTYLKKEEYSKTIKNLLCGKDDIIKLIGKNLSDEQRDNYFALSETLIYFYEKNSLIYMLKTSLSSLEQEPLEILKDCNKYLDDLEKHSKKYYDKLIYITQLFCLSYIKSYWVPI